MDRKLIQEIIEDFEKISEVVNFRLNQLRQMIGSPIKQNNIQSEMEKQRREIMQKMESIRQSTMDQIKQSVGNVSMPMMSEIMPNMSEMFKKEP
jgi:hypothetical protein